MEKTIYSNCQKGIYMRNLSESSLIHIPTIGRREIAVAMTSFNLPK